MEERIRQLTATPTRLLLTAKQYYEPGPRLRGRIHQYSFFIALAATVLLVVLAGSTRAIIAAAIYGVSLCLLFGVSWLYHRWPWPMHEHFRPLMRRFDHCNIFLFIAASATPIALLVLPHGQGTLLLIAIWVAAALGILYRMLWMDAPRGLTAAIYFLVGCLPLIALPYLLGHAAIAFMILLALGGLFYGLGALVYGLKRPNPSPAWFGYHEIFHALVAAAVCLHFIGFAVWVIPHGA